MSDAEVKMTLFPRLDMDCLNHILTNISKIKVALIGDLCLDMYWEADMTLSELSRETPHYNLPITEERISLGAGGNVAANLASLGVENVHLISVIGKDWRGNILKEKISMIKTMSPVGIIVSDKRVTTACCKPMKRGFAKLGYEDARIDFDNYAFPSSEDQKKLISLIGQVADEVDVICVSDQSKFGCITPDVRNNISQLGKDGHRIIVDSRYRIGLFSNVCIKPNEIEGVRAAFGETRHNYADLNEFFAAAKILNQKNNVGVCMTLGEKGCVYSDNSSYIHIPSYPVNPPIDICGAGDTFLSAFSCALATGVKPHEAASFANMAADVSIQKIGTTGTASPEEIKQRYQIIINNF